MAGGGVRELDQEMWRKLLEAEYFNIPIGQCRTCSNGRSECGKLFCVQCRVGGVCEATFRDGGVHAGHPGIRVWRITKKFAVCIDDVRKYMPPALPNQIQRYALNGPKAKFCKFVRKEDGAQVPWLRMCHGCHKSISQTTTHTNSSRSPVCSLMCLLDYAQAQQAAQQATRQSSDHSFEEFAKSLPSINEFHVDPLINN